MGPAGMLASPASRGPRRWPVESEGSTAFTTDPDAFDHFVARHRPGLVGFLYRRLGNRDEAEDAAAVTFAKAWRARATFRGEATGKAWLYGIACRVVLDLERRRRRRPVEQELPPAWTEEWLPEAEDPLTVLVEAERRRGEHHALRGALERLAPDDRRLLCLFYFDTLDYREISGRLGISLSQVRGRLYRVRERLRRDLERQGRKAPGAGGPNMLE
jgi:RNA polymerase sigma-70 factor, ECF subfamily